MSEALGHWPVFFAIDALRYAIPASLAFVMFWWWKWDALEHRRIQRRRPSTKALRREVRYSISTAMIFATVGVATYYFVGAGVLHMYFRVDDYGWAWWFASIAIAIVIHDAYFYWTHRALHHPSLFKHVHRVHHLSTSPSPWAAYAFSPAEALVNALVFPLVLLVVPMHQLAAFAFLAYMIVMNVIGHLGIELYPRGFAGSRWTGWCSTSTHHNLHHRDFHGNYGLYFTWWDKLMRTEHPAYQETFAAVTAEQINRPSRPARSIRTAVR
jgi:Delta7-sterol 5-desaturase